MESSAIAHVLVVAHKTAATPALLEAVGQRARRGPCFFHLLVPSPGPRGGAVMAPPWQRSPERLLIGTVQEPVRAALVILTSTVPAFRLLVVEDDPELRSLMLRGLSEEGFEVDAVSDGAGAMARIDDAPDGLIIDVGLPDTDGRDLCQALRARGCAAPVLFLTARDAVTDRLAGFSAGGDDYVTKPFHFDEVVARLRALLRRSGADPAATVGDLRLDPVSHRVTGDGRDATLTPTEFRVLAALAARPDEVVRRRELIRAAWPDGAIVHDNTLDQYVARLRRKLRDVTDDVTISTVHGVGYRLA